MRLYKTKKPQKQLKNEEITEGKENLFYTVSGNANNYIPFAYQFGKSS